ncbi:carotenoid cleavage dioxygenase, partial [Haematococcus lacustris]
MLVESIHALAADSGDLHFLGYDIEKPLVSVGSMDKHGDLQKVLKVPLPWTSMMHDMAITPRFKLLMHLPLVFDPQ